MKPRRLKCLLVFFPRTRTLTWQGCDLIIEAVFENIELKNKIIRFN